MPDDGALERLDRNLSLFRQLEERAVALAPRQPGAAATFAQMAGALAWLNHPGLFASPTLEVLLRDLAGLLPEARRRRADGVSRQRAREQVAHVLTAAYATGGHTRMVTRWIEADPGRAHQVILTHQQGRPIPATLADAVRAAGGRVTVLDQGLGGLLPRAAALRALVADTDVVLVSAHPYDVVPALALAGSETPAAFVNHADHVFWLGVGAATIVLNLRGSGRRLSIARRGVAEARCAIVARPLGSALSRSLPREDAKRLLGLEPSTIVLFTAADASKYEPFDSTSFLELLVPVLERHPNATLVAAGPSSSGAWARASARTGGRVMALGRRLDMAALHAAADVYIDSYPFASLTSLTEAGGLGVPLLAYRGHPDEAEVLGVDSPGLDETVLQPREPEAFRDELSRLIVDVAGRVELGLRTQLAIADAHSGDGWRAARDRLYVMVREVSPRPEIGTAPRGTGILDILVERTQRETGWATGLPGVLADHAGLLPAGLRLSTWWRGRRDGAPIGGQTLLPEWLVTAVRSRRGGRLRG